MSSEQAYKPLGAKVLSLPDVIAQSAGLIGPIFSAAFVIPLVVRVISASGKGGGVAAPLSVIIAGIGVFALAGSCRTTRGRFTRRLALRLPYARSRRPGGNGGGLAYSAIVSGRITGGRRIPQTPSQLHTARTARPRSVCIEGTRL